MSLRKELNRKKKIAVNQILLVTVALLVITINLGLSGTIRAEEVKIESPSAILMDAVSGEILYEKNAHEMRAPASTTKIMTLVLAFEALSQGRVSFSDIVTASENAYKMGGSQIYLKPGEQMTLRELLTSIAVGSANDACVAVAEYLAGSEEKFVEQMNSKAQELGMKDTTFKNPHGLDEEGHKSTAYDLALLARYAYNFPELFELTSIYDTWVRNHSLWLVNFNKLVKFYPGANGLKTGMTTSAKYCIVATAQRGKTKLIAVIMGAPTAAVRQADTIRLLNYGFNNFVSVPLCKAGEVIARILVDKGIVGEVGAVPESSVGLTVLKGDEKKLSQVVQLKPFVRAPIRKGDEVGEIVVSKDNKEVTRIRLVSNDDIPAASFLGLFWNFLRSFFSV